MIQRQVVGMACVSVVLAACEAGVTRSAAPVARDSAGIRIVENRGAAWDSMPAWTLGETPVLEIGAVSGSDAAYEFSLIRGLTRMSDGRIVVLESQSFQLRFFGPDGQHLITRGGRGRGPGEFNYPWRLHRINGDTLLVEDRPRITLHYFAPDGDYTRSAVLNEERYGRLGPWDECPGGSLPDGSLLLCRHDPNEPPRRPDPGPGHLRTYSQFVRATLELDSLIPLGRYGGIEQWGVSAGGRTRFAVHPFHSQTAVASGGSSLRIAIATNPEYSIEVWTPDGQLERIIRREAGRRVATAEDRRLANESLRSDAFGDEALANRFLAEVQPPDSFPAIRALLIDQTNHIWALQYGPLSASASIIAVFDPNGTLLGEMMLPDRFIPYEIGVDYVLGIFMDQYDVPYVHLYDLDRPTLDRQ